MQAHLVNVRAHTSVGDVAYDSVHRMRATYTRAHLYVTRYARLYGGSHVTRSHGPPEVAVDRQTNVCGDPLCKRKKRAAA